MAGKQYDPSKAYLLRGDTIQKMNAKADALWAGDNIQRGPGIYRRGSGSAGYSLAAKTGGGGGIISNRPDAWPWKVYDNTVGASGQVQLNGGDGFVASINGFVCNVNGSPNDTPLSGPPNIYPQLAITGDGVIYGYAVPDEPGTASPLTSLDLFYGGSIPSVDTANPATYYPFLIATVTGYTTDEDENVSFDLANVTNYGYTNLIYCLGAIQIY